MQCLLKDRSRVLELNGNMKNKNYVIFVLLDIIWDLYRGCSVLDIHLQMFRE